MAFGRTRVGGLLIWATEPGSGGSKGDGRRAEAASFAMAVSRGPISGIGRIWADGGMLRTDDGEFLTRTIMRLHSMGTAEPDPLIVAAEGVDLAPAYPHLSYVIFEDFDLGPYGNRIPSLSFELLSDARTPADWLDHIAGPLGVDVLARSVLPAGVEGYAARLDPVAEDLSALLGTSGCRIGQRDGRLAIIDEPRVIAVTADDLVRGDAEPEAEGQVMQGRKPGGLGLSFQDSNRDFQLGWQQEFRTSRGQMLSLSWPVSAPADVARSIALRLLQEAEAVSETIRLTLPLRFLSIGVGDAVRLGEGPAWLVVRREVRGLLVQLEGHRLPEQASHARVPTDSGRLLRAPDQPVPASAVVVVEPPVPIRPGTGAAILVSASGKPGWQGAAVRLLEGGEELVIGDVSAPVPFGVLVEDLGPGPESIWDEHNGLLVDVSAGNRPFLSRTSGDVLDGGGLISVGCELVQYRHASIAEPHIMRLSGLLRGRFGTNGACQLVPRGSLVMSVPRLGGVWLELPPAANGRDLALLVAGPGDPVGGSLVRHVVRGAGGAPLAPVHIAGRRLADGSLRCSWIPRDRNDWAWDATGVPSARPHMGHFRTFGGQMWSIAATPSGVVLSAAEQTNLFGAPFPPGEFRVEVIGDGPEELRMSPWVAVEEGV
jgi:hypothetical protein